MSKNTQEAIALLERVAKANPEDLNTRRKLTLALAKSGRFREAVASVLRAVAIHPEWAQFHYELLESLAKAGFGSRVHEAAEALAREEANSAAAWYVLGMACQTLHEHDEAEASFRKGLQRDPKNAAIHHHLGIARKALGLMALRVTEGDDASIASQREAIACSSTIAEPHYVLGVLYMKMGKREEAREHFEAFVKLAQPYLAAYIQEVQLPLRLLGGSSQIDLEKPSTRNPYWRCAGCGAVLKKSELGMMARTVVGVATCAECGAVYSQTDVYGGKYDVSFEETAATRAAGREFRRSRRKWWQLWR